MGVHDGHRERMRERFLEYGLENFNDLNALELLLHYAIPRKDTNALAHALIDRFGSLKRVLDASGEELMEVPGIGPGAASLIRLVPALARRYAVDETERLDCLCSAVTSGRYFVARLQFEKDEKALLACLDAQKRVLSCVELASGVVNSVSVNVRKVVETAIKYRASSVILAHNHPGGSAVPSREDQFLTEKISRALATVEIRLDDHIIVANKAYLSMAQAGFMNQLRI